MCMWETGWSGGGDTCLPVVHICTSAVQIRVQSEYHSSSHTCVGECTRLGCASRMPTAIANPLYSVCSSLCVFSPPSIFFRPVTLSAAPPEQDNTHSTARQRRRGRSCGHRYTASLSLKESSLSSSRMCTVPLVG